MKVSKDEMINDLEIIKHIDPLFSDTVVIYGTGSSGRKLYEEIKKCGVTVSAFCETEPQKEYMEGIPVIGQDELKELQESQSTLTVIASVYYNEIYDDLIRKGLVGSGIVSSFAISYAIYLNIDYPVIPVSFREEYKTIVKIWKKLQLRDVMWKKSLNDYRCLVEALMYDRLLIYQPGKVGSMSIHKSLEKSGIRTKHVHIINNRIMSKDPEYRVIINRLKERPLKIITGVRDPIARGISSFVHNLTQYYGPLIKDELSNDLCQSCIDFLRNYCCNDNLPNGKDIHAFNENEYTIVGNQMGNEFAWFDKEIKEVFDIDVFDYPFDCEKGYGIIKKDNIEIFIYKLEKLYELEEHIGNFVGVTDFKLHNENLGSDKMSRNIDRLLKKQIDIPEELLDYYYSDNPKCEHFYSKEELAYFKEKWTN